MIGKRTSLSLRWNRFERDNDDYPYTDFFHAKTIQNGYFACADSTNDAKNRFRHSIHHFGSNLEITWASLLFKKQFDWTRFLFAKQKKLLSVEMSFIQEKTVAAIKLTIDSFNKSLRFLFCAPPFGYFQWRTFQQHIELVSVQTIMFSKHNSWLLSNANV